MCGLVALFRRRGEPVSAGEVVAMRDLLAHRGPDGSGIHLDGAVGLGFRRLKIIDPAGGDQPMANARGTVHLVFNGEIYNYRSLRRLLLSRGIELRTQSDTETIVGLYELFGPRCVDYLHGMFAFVLWDAAERVMVAARDRLGIKPLYLLRRGETVAFASEIKAFLPLREWTPRLAEETVPEYLTYRSLALPRTMFRDVERVLPGELIVVSAGAVRRERYWSLPDPGAEPPAARRGAEWPDWVDELDDLLTRVVAEHLVSDVPLGTFNSGGVDSSLVTALAAGASGGGAGPLNTYSVGFAEPAYDESPYAELVAARFATRHRRLLVGGEEYAEWLPRAIWYHDEPLDHPHCVHLLRLAQLARQEVTVVLTGEGADELFGGYRRYLLPALLDRYPLPASWLRLAIGGLPGLAGRLQPLERLRALALLGNGSGPRVQGLAAFASEAEVRRLLVAAPGEEIEGRNGAVATAGMAGRPTLLAQTLWLDQQTYLQSLLNRLDRMMMAASVEGRVPFLDHRVVELAARVPARLKVRGGETKRLLKQVGRRHLPAAITGRRKAGFAVPIAQWLRPGGPLDAATERLLAPGAAVHAHLDAGRLRELVGEHRGGRCDHQELLWAAINLETWHRVWSDAARSAAAGRAATVEDGLALGGRERMSGATS